MTRAVDAGRRWKLAETAVLVVLWLEDDGHTTLQRPDSYRVFGSFASRSSVLELVGCCGS